MQSTITGLRVGLALFFAGLLVATGGISSASEAAAAAACTCSQTNRDEDLASYAAKAQVVFTGTLDAVRRAPKLPAEPKSASPARLLRYDVAVERVYQGTLVDTVTASVAAKKVRAGCELGQLQVDKPYVFFVDLVDGALVVGGTCSGTQELKASVLADLDTLFAPPPVPKPVPPTATRTKVDDSVPVEFARLAAPGAALVVLGALGLAVVSRLGREY